jgi:non-specific serine/threonine protein kinase
VRSCRAVAVLCSATSIASRNVRQELQLAWDRDKPILPLLLEPVEFPDAVAYFLQGRQWIEVHDRPSDDWLPGITRALARLGIQSPPSGPEPAEIHRRPVNLPSPLTALLGRDDEVARVVELLNSHRLVTLIGPGGVGKTRLAIDAARQAAPAFPDGVTFVDLAPIRDPALVLPVIARALDVRETPGRTLPEVLTAALDVSQTLLVLDNVEQVIDAATEIAGLLVSCPRLAMLVTSRSLLGVRGESLVSIDPLPVPSTDSSTEVLGDNAAVRLFVERAQGALPGFVPIEDDLGVIARICHRLDGLPLALELAAARTRLLAPAALLSRLELALPTLTGGPRDLPDRQRTLRDTIAWSHDLLTPREQILFRRLGVFVEGWTLEAAEAVCDEEKQFDVLDMLTSLVGQSLVEVNVPGGPRYRMLETIREYAQGRLQESGEEETTRAAHASYFSLLGVDAARTHALYPERFAAQLSVEAENMRAALDWTSGRADADTRLRLALAWTYLAWYRGGFADVRRRLEQVLPDLPFESVLYAEGYEALSVVADALGDQHAAADAAALSEASARAHGNDFELARALLAKAMALNGLGELEQAARVYEESATLSRRVAASDPVAAHVLTLVLNNLGCIAEERGDADLAAEYYQRALDAAVNGGLGHEHLLHYTMNLASMYLERGQTDEAARRISGALDMMTDESALGLVTFVLEETAYLAEAVGRHTEAGQLLGAAVEVERLYGAVTERQVEVERSELIAKLAAALGNEACQEAMATGRAVPIKDAIAQANALVREIGMA